MAKNKFLRILAAAVAVILGIGLLVILEGHANILLAPEPTEAALQQEPEYNALGMRYSDALSTEILYEDDALVCYSDRTLRKFSYNPANAEYLAQALTGLRGNSSRIENLLVMPIPLRITLEAGWEGEAEEYREYMDLLKKTLPSGVTLVDAYPVLEQHKDEYIFFRTEDSWTARGGYYGMEALGDALGIETLPLEQYEEYMYRTYRGSTWLSACEKVENDPVLYPIFDDAESDSVTYYLYPGSANRMEVLNAENEKTLKRPFIATSENGTNTFGGALWERAVTEGDGLDATKGSHSVLLICDYRGRMVVPFLANYYDQVYMVDVTWYGDLTNTLDSILTEYNIEDVIVVQGAEALGDDSFSNALNDFVS